MTPKELENKRRLIRDGFAVSQGIEIPNNFIYVENINDEKIKDMFYTPYNISRNVLEFYEDPISNTALYQTWKGNVIIENNESNKKILDETLSLDLQGVKPQHINSYINDLSNHLVTELNEIITNLNRGNGKYDSSISEEKLKKSITGKNKSDFSFVNNFLQGIEKNEKENVAVNQLKAIYKFKEENNMFDESQSSSSFIDSIDNISFDENMTPEELENYFASKIDTASNELNLIKKELNLYGSNKLEYLTALKETYLTYANYINENISFLD